MRLSYVLLGFMIAMPTTGHASQHCTREGYRVQRNGDRVPTPYCQAELLSRVARDYGMNVSAAPILRRPDLKERICDVAGSDSRIRIACALRR